MVGSERAFFGVAVLAFAGSAALTTCWSVSMSSMGTMPMAGGWAMSAAWMRMPGQTWLGAAVSFLTMWIVMMTAMMLPSFVPMLRRYRRAARGRKRSTAGLADRTRRRGLLRRLGDARHSGVRAGCHPGGDRDAAPCAGTRGTPCGRCGRRHGWRASVHRVEGTPPRLLPARGCRRCDRGRCRHGMEAWAASRPALRLLLVGADRHPARRWRDGPSRDDCGERGCHSRASRTGWCARRESDRRVWPGGRAIPDRPGGRVRVTSEGVPSWLRCPGIPRGIFPISGRAADRAHIIVSISLSSRWGDPGSHRSRSAP